MPEHRPPADLDQGRCRTVLPITAHRIDRCRKRNVIEGDDRHVGGHGGEVRLQPRQLNGVHVSVLPEVGDVHRVEPDEVHAAVS